MEKLDCSNSLALVFSENFLLYFLVRKKDLKYPTVVNLDRSALNIYKDPFKLCYVQITTHHISCQESNRLSCIRTYRGVIASSDTETLWNREQEWVHLTANWAVWIYENMVMYRQTRKGNEKMLTEILRIISWIA